MVFVGSNKDALAMRKIAQAHSSSRPIRGWMRQAATRVLAEFEASASPGFRPRTEPED
jgi:hypothetical protein